MDETLDDLTLTYNTINKLFVYKAEWLAHDMFKLYTKPNYFPEITGVESCVLIGGRGTGKTTVLKGLSYQGVANLSVTPPPLWDYYGLYYKVESNRVSAFADLGKKDEEWIRPFSHYMNLVILSLAIDLVIWLENEGHIEFNNLSNSAWRTFESSLGCEPLRNFSDIKALIDSQISKFENFINSNISGNYNLTILGGPIDRLFEAFESIGLFKQKKIFILIDEYENFSEYQQKVINTLIKQSAGKSYCFKIGVRELGWKSRITLNNQELRSPSDYRKIEILAELENDFEKFAKDVCEERLAVLYKDLKIDAKPTIINLLPSLSIEEEAELLGIKDKINKSTKCKELALLLPNQHPLFIWYLHNWDKNNSLPSETIVYNYKNNTKAEDERYENYKYAYLFSIRENKIGIRKYYSGWPTLVKMAGANIRFLLQLVEMCLKLHLKDEGKIGQPVKADVQTKAAQKVGSSNLEELEGLDVHGNYIMQLLQGIGRVFELMARQPFGHAPEVNQFSLIDKEVDNELWNSNSKINIDELFVKSISHLALRRSISTKLSHQDTKSYDYSVHPIFSALFQISHRRKRKLNLSKRILLELIVDQRSTIETILKTQNRIDSTTNFNKIDDIYTPKVNKATYEINKEPKNQGGEQLKLF